MGHGAKAHQFIVQLAPHHTDERAELRRGNSGAIIRQQNGAEAHSVHQGLPVNPESVRPVNDNPGKVDTYVRTINCYFWHIKTNISAIYPLYTLILH